MKLTLLLLLSPFLFVNIQAQCTVASPTEVPATNVIPYHGEWKVVVFSGNAGHDYYTFWADASKTYIFSTHMAQGSQKFGATDLQLTIQDSMGVANGGKFGQSFQDDYNLGMAIYDPFITWSPTSSGRYRVLLTKYQSGGCVELASGDSVLMYTSAIPTTGKFAIFHEIIDSTWNTSNNWYSYNGSGLPQIGRPTDLKDYFVLANGKRYGTSPLTTSDSCQVLCLEDYSTSVRIPAGKSLEVFDSLENYGTIMGDGDLIAHADIDISNIAVSELVLKGNASGKEIVLSQNVGSPVFLDTLTIANVKGVRIDGAFHTEWVKFQKGVLKMGQPSHPLIPYFLLVTGGHSGASAQSYVNQSNDNPVGGLFAPRVVFVVRAGGYLIPIGNNTRYRPVKIDLSYSDSVAIEAYYFNISYNRLLKDSTLSEVSSLEYWNIYEDINYSSSWNFGPAVGTISLSWDNQSGVNPADLVDLRVACNDTNDTKWLNRGQTAISSSGSTGWISSIPSAVEKVYTLAAVNGSHALPIDGFQLTGKVANEGIQLTWTAQQALEGSLLLEKSVNREDFTSLYQPLLANSQWLDQNPQPGKNYYRMKYVDMAGNISYSSIIELNWENNQLSFNYSMTAGRELLVQPILTQKAPASLEIIDIHGRICFSQSISPHGTQLSINLSHLSQGMYFLQLQQNGKVKTRQLRL